jgi:hypothetical protein
MGGNRYTIRTRLLADVRILAAAVMLTGISALFRSTIRILLFLSPNFHSFHLFPSSILRPVYTHSSTLLHCYTILSKLLRSISATVYFFGTLPLVYS